MSTTAEKIEKGYRIPCGPMDIGADSVCRRSLKDSMDSLLDRLTLETSTPTPQANELPKDLEVDGKGQIVSRKGESDEERKDKMIREGKLRAEVQAEIKKYREELQGNSKMLQDISGEIVPR